jgi:transposase
MTVTPDIEAEIRRLYFAEHWRRGTIGAQLGLHDDVVKRVIGPTGRGAKASGEPMMILDPFLVVIAETLERYPRLRATRLYDMLVGRGYEGSIRTLRRYVATVRPLPKSEVFLRVEPLIAEQAQIDWAHVGYLQFPGGRRALWVFVLVLSYSRAMWGEFVLDLSVHSLRRSLLRAAQYFDGSPRQWLFDNPKTVVLERHGDAVRFHPALLDLAGSLHVQPRLCAVRKPQQKGRVERAIRFLRERFLAARTIHGVEHGNVQLLDFIERIAHPRPHPRWPDRTVADVLEEERHRLLALPDVLPGSDLVHPVVADKTAFVQFDTNAYSVPPRHARTTLTLVASDVDVRLLDGSVSIAQHARCWGRHQRIESPEHRAELLAQKRQGKDLKGRDRLQAEVAGVDALFAAWVVAGRNIGSMTARTLQLLNLYGADVLSSAVAEVTARGSHDPGALAVVCDQHRQALRRAVPVPVVFGDHVKDRDVVPHDLGGYDE